MKNLNYFNSFQLESGLKSIMGGNTIPPCTPDLNELPEEQKKQLEELLAGI
jgi:hypothetical protein